MLFLVVEGILKRRFLKVTGGLVGDQRTSHLEGPVEDALVWKLWIEYWSLRSKS